MLTQGESPTHPHHTSSFPACSALNLCLRQGQGAHHSHRQPLKPLHTHHHTTRHTDRLKPYTKNTHTHTHTHTRTHTHTHTHTKPITCKHIHTMHRQLRRL